MYSQAVIHLNTSMAHLLSNSESQGRGFEPRIGQKICHESFLVRSTRGPECQHMKDYPFDTPLQFQGHSEEKNKVVKCHYPGSHQGHWGLQSINIPAELFIPAPKTLPVKLLGKILISTKTWNQVTIIRSPWYVGTFSSWEWWRTPVTLLLES